MPQAPAPGALPPATAAQLHEWRMLWTEAMCESCLPFGCFETAEWRAALGSDPLAGLQAQATAAR